MTDTTMTAEQAAEVLVYHRADLTSIDRLRLHLRDNEETWEAPLMEDVLGEADDLSHAATHYRERAEKAEEALAESRREVGRLSVLDRDVDRLTKHIEWSHGQTDAAEEALAAAEAEVAVLRGRLGEAEAEREKYRFSAVQFCAAHIGVPLYSCPVCAEPNIAHQATTPEPYTVPAIPLDPAAEARVDEWCAEHEPKRTGRKL